MCGETSQTCCGEDKLCALTCCPCSLDLEKIKTIVKDSKFICKVCGRAANSEKNLCQPVPIN